MSPDAPHLLALIAAGEVLVRMELADMLKGGGFRVVPVASAEEALELLAATPDIQAVVTDVNLSPGSIDGVDLARRVCGEWRIGVVVLSEQVIPDDELPSGVHFLAKPLHAGTLVHLVRLIMRARVQETLSAERAASPPRETTSLEAEEGRALTPRQQEVLELLVQGKSNREIAEALDMAENTVKVHVLAIFKVLGVSSRVEAVLTRLRHIPGKPR